MASTSTQTKQVSIPFATDVIAPTKPDDCTYVLEPPLEKEKSLIWASQVPERVRSFIWILNHNMLLTNLKMSAYGFGNANRNLCGSVVEHTIHTLRDCNMVRKVWENRVSVSMVQAFYGSNLQDWITLNVMHSLKEDKEWCNYWALGCHLIWTWRNKENHIDNYKRPFNPVVYIEERLHDYRNALITNAITMDNRKMVTLVKWNPPREMFVKLNVNGYMDKDGVAGCGGLIRDEQGRWISGFAKFIGKCIVLAGELWGIIVGMKLIMQHGFSKVEVNSDSRVDVEVLSKARKNMAGVSNMEQQIIQMMTAIGEVEITFTHKETNTCANSLACHGRVMQNDSHIFHEAPDFLAKDLKMDIDGVLVSKLLGV